MTLAPIDKNISLTYYKLDNWLNFKSSMPSTKIKHYSTGTIALVSASLFSLAETVSRITMGSIGLALMKSAVLRNKKGRNFCINQIQKGTHAGSIFLSIIFFKDLVDCLEAAKPPKILSSKKRLNRIIQGKRVIADKLQKELNCAKKQAIKEPNKAFKYLSAPVDFKLAHFNRVQAHIETGICYYQGRRKSMEDEDLITFFELIVKHKNYPVALFGVFDGHGGSGASRYVKLHLKEQLQETLTEFCFDRLTDEAIWNTLKIAFVKLHKGFAQWKNEHYLSHTSEGTTATVAMILNEKLWIANTGDSRAILDNGCQLSEDAKPENPRYKRGIESRDGKVLTIGGIARVNGSLSLARALGDHNVKGINPRPKITMCPLSEIPEKSCLIIACDGIYDVSSTRQVAAAIRAHKDCSAAQLAKNIVYSAYKAGSKDNLSALVVKL